MVCVKCLVSGRVQGVWYRGTTRRKAMELGLTGSAVNLADGRVQVVACGTAQAVAELQDWLWQGPEHAEVTDVSCQPLSLAEPPAGFTTA